jgi:hypothetical protein
MSKRANGEGTIVKRSDGRWRAALMINGETSYFYGRTQREVKEKLEKAKEDCRKGMPVKLSKLTFGEWLNTWVEQYAKPNVSPTTYDSYKYHIKDHIIPDLGDIVINQLQPPEIQKFYTKKLAQKVTRHTKNGPIEIGKTIAFSTVYKMHVIINSALSQALQAGLVYRNAAQATKPPKVEKHEANI